MGAMIVAPAVPAEASGLPTLVPGATSVIQPAGGTVVQVPISLSTASTSAVTASWSTIAPAGSAPSSDYDAGSGTLTIPAGQTTATVPVTVLADSTGQVEYVVVSFSHPSGAVMGGFWGLGFAYIDPGPAVEPGTTTVTAPTSGTVEAEVPVTLSAASSQTVTVAWTTLSVSGATPTEAPTTDYQAANGTVTFAAGQTTATVPVVVTGNTSGLSEYVLVSFHDPTHATIGGTWGLGGVLIDPPPTLGFPAEPTLPPPLANPVTLDEQVPITLSAASTEPVTVTWTTGSVEAVQVSGGWILPCVGTSPSSATVTFPAGTTTEYINTTISCSPGTLPPGLTVAGYSVVFELSDLNGALTGKNSAYILDISS